jgi:transcriptional/translational regulatory protein YebC/TACO1
MTTPEAFSAVNDAIVASGLTPDNAEVTFSAATLAELDQEAAEKLMKLVDHLEDLDDVQDVYTNADISDEIMATLE